MTSPPKSFSLTTTSSIKFLCSYGGKILPRPSDGHLRYVGGLTRVVSVPRSVSFTELSEKLQELCSHAVILRCQLPTEDLDILVTIKSDEDLMNLIEVYDKAAEISGKEMKIRAILSRPKSKSMTSLSSPASPVSSSSSSPDISPSATDRRRWSHRKPPIAAVASMNNRNNIPRRVYQYKVVGDCYHNYYPRPQISSSYFSPQHSNLWH